MLLPVLGRGKTESADTRRRVLLNTIGPVWDGNEVWLITAGGALFAAFPEWYATLFSGFYLPLLLILLALIVRVCAIEWRGKIDDPVWRRRCDWGIIFGSWVPAVLWGVAFANIVRGVAIDADKQYVGGFFDLLNPYALLGGVTTALVFALHGAVFIALKTSGDIRTDAVKLSRRLSVPTVLVAGAFVLWTQLAYGKTWTLDPRRRRCGRTARRCRAGRRRARGLGFRVHHRGHRGDDRAAVRVTVPERHAVHARSGVVADHRERVVERLHPEDHDVGRRRRHARGPALPGVDVLGVPPADLDLAHPAVDRSEDRHQVTVAAATVPAGAEKRRRGPIDPRLWRYSASARGYLALTVLTSLVDVVMVVVERPDDRHGAGGGHHHRCPHPR